jgi:hypothetical protein
MLMALMLIGALVGGGVGALVTRSSADSTSANTATDTAKTQPVNYAPATAQPLTADNSAQFRTMAEQTAYQQGFDAGLAECTDSAANYSRTTYQPNYRTNRTTTTRRSARSSSNTRRVYYDYSEAPKGRSFWQKHRDKLTLAIGTGAGAGVGALIGGKKGAGIGALAGLGGSALYTYKLRKRDRNY